MAFATIVLEHPGSAIENKAGSVASDHRPQYKARRPHTKSRSGCSTCKSRHLKCDEHRPTCGQCTYGQRRCVYSSLPVQSRHPSESRREHITVPSLPISIQTDLLNGYCSETPTIGTTGDPAELLDHFKHATHRIWIGGPSCQRIMQQQGPSLSVEAPYLRFAILSFSAQHLATIRPVSSNYELAGSMYYNRALRSYSNALGNPNTANLDALFACYILLSMIAHKHLLSSLQGQSPSTEAGPAINVTALRAMAGSRILKAVPSLRSQLDQSVIIGQCDEDSGTGLQSVAEYAERLATVERLERFCRVDERATTSGGVQDAALGSLRRLMLSDLGEGTVMTYLFFTRGFDPRFFSSIERNEIRTYLALCYWYALGARIGQWWMAESARLAGKKLLDFLRKHYATEIQGLLEFPAACLESSTS